MWIQEIVDMIEQDADVEKCQRAIIQHCHPFIEWARPPQPSGESLLPALSYLLSFSISPVSVFALSLLFIHVFDSFFLSLFLFSLPSFPISMFLLLSFSPPLSTY